MDRKEKILWGLIVCGLVFAVSFVVVVVRPTIKFSKREPVEGVVVAVDETKYPRKSPSYVPFIVKMDSGQLEKFNLYGVSFETAKKLLLNKRVLVANDDSYTYVGEIAILD